MAAEQHDRQASRWEPSAWLREQVLRLLHAAYGDWLLEHWYRRFLIDWAPGVALDRWTYGARTLDHPRLQGRPCDRCWSRVPNVRALVVVGAAAGIGGVRLRGLSTTLCRACLGLEGIVLDLAAEIDHARLVEGVAA